MKKKLFMFITVFLLIACDNNQLMEQSMTMTLPETKTRVVKPVQSMPDYLWHFVEDVSSNLPMTRKNKVRSTASRTIESVIPIIELNDTLMWVINYSNRQGYMVLSTERSCFPILAFNDEGCFDANPTSNSWIDEKKDLIKSIKKNKSSNVDNSNSDLWDKIMTPKAGVEMSYELVTNVSNERSDYVDVEPLLLTQWGDGWGYHYEMPIVTELIFGTHKVRVPDFVVTVGQYLHYYRHLPIYGSPTFDYNKMFLTYGTMVPSLDKPNDIATMMRFICDYFGYKVVSDRMYVNPTDVPNVTGILTSLGFRLGYHEFAYWWEKSSESYQIAFDDIHRCLLKGYPTIGGVMYLVHNWNEQYNWDKNDKIAYTFIVDGTKKIALRVTEKSALGSNSYTYQNYYLHYVRPDNGDFSKTGPTITGGYNYTGWYSVDYINWIWETHSRYYVYTACTKP